MQKTIKRLLESSIEVKRALITHETGNIEAAAKALVKAFASKKKLLVFGNGGSAADSLHFAAEMVGRFKKERRPLPAIALTANISTITAVANDYSFDTVFARQVEALGVKGDVAFGISTSGNSRNVVEAMRKAKELGMMRIGLTGCGGGALKPECDILIALGSNDTPRVQESHIAVIHILCELVEEELFS